MSELCYADLQRDHEAIETLAKRLAVIVDDTAVAPEELSATLEQLVETVRDHLAHEDEMIYTLALQAQPGITQDAVRRTQSEFDQLKANWGEYLMHWSAAAIRADRGAFVRATRAMLPRLRDRVRLESQLLIASALVKPSRVRSAALG